MAHSLETSLISYWRLNDASGSTRLDAHDSNNLSPSGAAGRIEGKVDEGDSGDFALQLGPVPSGFLHIDDNTALSTGDINFTIACWVYLDSKTGRRAFVGKWRATDNNREYLLEYDPVGDRYRFRVSTNGTAEATVSANNFGSPAVATWHLVIAWHDAGANTINIQVNNGTANSAAHAGGVFDSAAHFQIGHAFHSATEEIYMRGRIDDVGFWKKILTAAERSELYAGGLGNAYDWPDEHISTIKPAGGGAFTSLQAWESAMQRSLISSSTGANEIEVAEVYSGGNAGDNSTTLTIDGWTTDSTRWVEIRGAEGHWHEGLGTPYITSRAYIDFTGAAHVVDIRVDDCRLNKMQFIKTSGTGNFSTCHFNSLSGGGANQQAIVDKCIFVLETAGSLGGIRVTGGGNQVEGGQAQNNIFKNCLIMSRSTSASEGAARMVRVNVSNEGATRFSHCTIIARVDGHALVTDATTGHIVISRNNYLRRAAAGSCYGGLAANYRKGGADSTNNAEALHFTHRNIPFTTASFVSITANAEDLHINFNASGLYRSGDNLPQFPFAPSVTEFLVLDDFEGDIRLGASGLLQPSAGSGGKLDVGMDQVPTAAGPAYIGGYMEAVAKGPVSGFIGGYALGGGHPVGPGIIGGYLMAKAIDELNKVGILGGYLKADGGQISASVGGFCFSVPLTTVPPAFIGGLASGLRNKGPELIGGYMLGHPDCTEFAELHARTLVKVRSQDVVDQQLNLDCVVIFKGVSSKDFNARFIWFGRAAADFNARFKVEDYKHPPLVQILSVTPSSGTLGPGGCRKVTVVASGTLMDGQEWVNAYIDFGEPFKETDPRTYTINMSISGFNTPPPWTTYHDYCVSGKYVVTARGQDNLGMVGMDAFRLNLASGLSENMFPKISISGQPRTGFVPDALKIDFNTQSSGVPSPPNTAQESNLSKVGSVSDRRILWNFGNREISQKTNPYTYYQSPGLYAPALRYLYQHPSGHRLWVSDTLLIGFNK